MNRYFHEFYPEKDLRSAEISGLDATIQKTRGTKLKEMCNKLPAYKLKIKIYVACCPQAGTGFNKEIHKQTNTQTQIQTNTETNKQKQTNTQTQTSI